MMGGAPITIVDIDDEVLPDNSFPGAHAFYLLLSAEPSADWQREFEHVCRLKVATRRRVLSIVGSRLRVVVKPTEHIQTVLRHVQEAVATTNARLAES